MSYITHGLGIGLAAMAAVVSFCAVGLVLVGLAALIGSFIQWCNGESDEEDDEDD